MTMITTNAAMTITVASLLAVFSVIQKASAAPVGNAGNLPQEVPISMMQFPPLQTMPFEPVRTLEIKPVEKFTDGGGLYSRNCADCHGEIAVSQKKRASLPRLGNAIRNIPAMKKLSGMDPHEQQSIIQVLQ